MKVKLTYFYRSEAKSKSVDIQDIINSILSKKHIRAVEQLRERISLFKTEGITSSAAKETMVPIVHFASYVPDSGMEPATTYTGLVTVTIPIAGKAAETLRPKLTTLPQVMAVFTGSSGETLKVVIPYRLTDNTLPASEMDVTHFHATAYRSCALFIKQLTGITPIGEDGDWHHGTRMSADDGIFFNPDAVAITMPQPSELPVSLTLNEDTEQEDVTRFPCLNYTQEHILKFSLVWRNMNLSIDDAPENYIQRLAANCRKSGVDEELAIKSVLNLHHDSTIETMVRLVFDNAYSTPQKGTRITMEKSLLHLMHLRRFLKRRYIFRRNEITDSIEYIEHSRYITSWRPVNDRAIKSICMAAHTAGIEAWENDIDRFINSNETHSYDPISDFISSLPEWDGRDRISELADSVKTTSPNWKSDFGTWLRSMVNQWTKRGNLHGSTTVLMLIGTQGTGKSTFFKRLLPKELSPYYIDRIDFSTKREAERALTRFALICMDEFDQISNSQVAFLKHIIQKSDVKFRKLYQDEIEQHNRYAAFCATTNAMQPLTDPTGSRRYLCIELTAPIDNTTQIDHQQLYAQILKEITDGKKTYFTSSDEARIQESNSTFTIEQPLESMLLSLFAKGDKSAPESKWLTAAEILLELKQTFKNQRIDSSSTRQLGRTLINLRYPHRRSAKGTQYHVKRAE